MNVGFNLASHPYENLRPRYLLAWMAVGLVLILALLLVGRERQQRAETRSLTQQMGRFEQEMQALAGQQRELEEWLRRPEVQEIRDHSAFLNSLIARKSLSWTRMFLDLEKILPARAQVTAIQPRLNRARQPELALSVTAEDMPPLLELLRNLESSAEFGSPAVQAQRFTSDRSSQTRIALDLSTQYRQALPEPASSVSTPDSEASPPPEDAFPNVADAVPNAVADNVTDAVTDDVANAVADNVADDAAVARQEGGF